MDYGIYFETLIRTNCYERPEWAINLGIVLMFLTASAIIVAIFSLQWIHSGSIVPQILIVIAMLLIFITLMFIQYAPIYTTGEYKYEVTITEAFNLSEFEMDERFTNIEYSNGTLKFKSYEYIEGIEK